MRTGLTNSRGGGPSISSDAKFPAMATKRRSRAKFFLFLLSLVAFGAFAPVFAPLPSLSSSSLSSRRHIVNARKFEIADDKFWKDGKPFQIIGGDLHYFRILPEYWEDRLLRAKAFGLNTIQTYVPWNLHEPSQGELDFEGIGDIVSFLKLCQKLDLQVMLRAGPYICAEWDLGGFPPWLLAIEPALRLRSSDPAFLDLVESWWGVLLPLIAPLLYGNGGPIIMVQDFALLDHEGLGETFEAVLGVHYLELDYYHSILDTTNSKGSQAIMAASSLSRQKIQESVIAVWKSENQDEIENEFGSYGNDKVYLHHLVTFARGHLGDEIILYTTDGGSREALEKGTIRGDAVFSAVDFTTGDDPWPIFELQKEFNAPGKSPPLSAEFYTGWLTHWGEEIAKTDADSTAAALEKILSRNGSAVLYMAHGGTNFGFYSGANTGANEHDYKPDLTSYDYDAPIKESGDVDNAKFKALHRVIKKYHAASLPSVPSDNKKSGYGRIRLQKSSILFDTLNIEGAINVAESQNPISMESAGQMFGLMLYVSEFRARNNGSILSIPEVHDRAQVFISCSSKSDAEQPTYIGTIERWSNKPLGLPHIDCPSNTSLFILVENMGRVNYGQFMFDRKGILSSVYLSGKALRGWKMLPVPFQNLNGKQKVDPVIQVAYSEINTSSAHKKLKESFENSQKEPALYAGYFRVDETSQLTDTYISFRGWGKGIAFVNEFNIGRYWPSFGPQCNLYVPAPVLRYGENVVVILELDSPNPDLVVTSVDQPDFTCGSRSSKVHQL